MKLIAFFGRLQCRKTPHNFEMWIMPIHFEGQLFTSFLHGGVVPNSPSLSTDLDASERICEYIIWSRKFEVLTFPSELSAKRNRPWPENSSSFVYSFPLCIHSRRLSSRISISISEPSVVDFSSQLFSLRPFVVDFSLVFNAF